MFASTLQTTAAWLGGYHPIIDMSLQSVLPQDRVCGDVSTPLPTPTSTTGIYGAVRFPLMTQVASLYDRVVSLDDTWVLWPALEISYTGLPVKLSRVAWDLAVAIRR